MRHRIKSLEPAPGFLHAAPGVAKRMLANLSRANRLQLAASEVSGAVTIRLAHFLRERKPGPGNVSKKPPGARPFAAVSPQISDSNEILHW